MKDGERPQVIDIQTGLTEDSEVISLRNKLKVQEEYTFYVENIREEETQQLRDKLKRQISDNKQQEARFAALNEKHHKEVNKLNSQIGEFEDALSKKRKMFAWGASLAFIVGAGAGAGICHLVGILGVLGG